MKSGFSDMLAPYTSVGKVNRIEMPIIRDTGATLDLICRKYVRPSMYTNETVWIRTPLEEHAVCLPIAEVELDCDLYHIITKAAVLRNLLNQGRYLLGNKTASLYDEAKKNKEIEIYMVNAVQTRSQKKINEDNDQNLKPSDEILSEINDSDGGSSNELDDILPLLEPKISEFYLIRLSRKEFVEEQKKSAELKVLFEDTENESSKKTKYIIVDKLLFVQKEDKDGMKRKLLVVPEKYIEHLMRIGHEGTAAHLGVTKTKDALSKTFYWPNCFSDIENFVKSYDKE